MQHPLPRPLHHHHAFTLLEMAIVLIIIGLLTGGILTGQSLIKNARLRDMQTSVEQYRKAIQQFNDVYAALPGDMYNATSIWGARDSGDGLGVDCTDVASVDALTCNGNGDGYIAAAAATGYEAFRAWQQLRNAELITGSYTGIRSSVATNWHSTAGTNIPSSSLANNTGFNIRYETGTSMFTATFPYHYITLGANTTNDYNNAAALTNEDAWNIDKKMDDGLPGQGAIVTYTNAGLTTCASTSVATTAAYQLSSTSIGCILLFRINN